MTKVDGTIIDVCHETRSVAAVCNAIGKAVLRLCQRVPHGVVVFLPSYRYEPILVEAWLKGTNSIWRQLHSSTTVMREPKEASQMDVTLCRYGQAATSSRRHDVVHYYCQDEEQVNSKISEDGGTIKEQSLTMEVRVKLSP